MFIANYVKKYSTYEPVKFVSLLFLVRKSNKAKFNIPIIFQAPDTLVYTKPRKYQELQYRFQATKLQMEFHLHLFELFCCVGYIVYSVFNGTKILCASLVSANHISIYIFAILLLSPPSLKYGNLGRLKLKFCMLCYFSSTRAKAKCALIL